MKGNWNDWFSILTSRQFFIYASRPWDKSLEAWQEAAQVWISSSESVTRHPKPICACPSTHRTLFFLRRVSVRVTTDLNDIKE